MSRTVLERIAGGDTAAVRECLDRYGGVVWSLARRLSADRADAEDAAQEIFIDVWRNAARFDPQIASEITFIAMIARRRLIDRQRRRGRSPQVTSLDRAPDLPAVPPTDRTAVADEAARARELMQRLRPEERQVLELAIDRGLSQTQIASALNLPLGTGKSHARRGLLALRQMLEVSPREGVRGGV